MKTEAVESPLFVVLKTQEDHTMTDLKACWRYLQFELEVGLDLLMSFPITISVILYNAK